MTRKHSIRVCKMNLPLENMQWLEQIHCAWIHKTTPANKEHIQPSNQQVTCDYWHRKSLYGFNVSLDASYLKPEQQTVSQRRPDVTHGELVQRFDERVFRAMLQKQDMPVYCRSWPPAAVNHNSQTILHQTQWSGSPACTLLEYVEQYPLLRQLVGMNSRLIKYTRSGCNTLEELKLQQQDDDDIVVFNRRPAKPENASPDETLEYSLLSNEASPVLAEVNLLQSLTVLENKLFVAPVHQHQAQKGLFVLRRPAVAVASPDSNISWSIAQVGNVYAVGQMEPKIPVPRPGTYSSLELLRGFIHAYLARLYVRMTEQGQTPHFTDVKIIKLFLRRHEAVIRKMLDKRYGLTPYLNKVKTTYYYTKNYDPKRWLNMCTAEDVCRLYSMQYGVYRLQQQGISKLYEPLRVQDEITCEYQRNVFSYINQQLELTPWNLSECYMMARTGMCELKLHGTGNPFQRGNGYSFLRVLRGRQKPGTDDTELVIPKRKVNTEADLRTITNDEQREILRKFGVPQSKWPKKRWPRVTLITALAKQHPEIASQIGAHLYKRDIKESTKDRNITYSKEIQNIFSNMQLMLAGDVGRMKQPEVCGDEATHGAMTQSSVPASSGTSGRAPKRKPLTQAEEDAEEYRIWQDEIKKQKTGTGVVSEVKTVAGEPKTLALTSMRPPATSVPKPLMSKPVIHRYIRQTLRVTNEDGSEEQTQKIISDTTEVSNFLLDLEDGGTRFHTSSSVSVRRLKVIQATR